MSTTSMSRLWAQKRFTNGMERFYEITKDISADDFDSLLNAVFFLGKILDHEAGDDHKAYYRYMDLMEAIRKSDPVDRKQRFETLFRLMGGSTHIG